MKITRITLMITLLILLYLPFVAMASSHGRGRHHGTTGAAARVHQDHQPTGGHVDGHAGYYGTGAAASGHQDHEPIDGHVDGGLVDGHAGYYGATGAVAKGHQGTGTIESVNVAENTVRVDHEPIEELRWPRMVMDLKTKDADLLKGLEQGDRIVFDLMRTDEGYLITRIEKKH